MYDIFISYSRHDRKRIAKLVDALTAQRGWSIWWDKQVQTGSRFTREIEQALEQSRCVITVWSNNSVESDWVRSESDQGRKRGILAPISFDATQPPIPFDQTETTDFSNWQGAENAAEFLQLIEAVQRILSTGAVPGTEELLQREARQAIIRRRRKLRVALGAAALLFLFGGILFGYNQYTRQQQAIDAADRLAAESGRYLALAQARNNEDERKRKWWWLLFDSGGLERFEHIDLSLLLAIEALRTSPTDDAMQALRDSLAILPFSDWGLTSEGQWGNGQALDFSFDGSLLAVGGSPEGTLVWDYRADKVLSRFEHAINPPKGWENKHGNKYYSRGRQLVDFSPVDFTLVTAGLDGSVKLWDAKSGKELHQMNHEDHVVAVRFSPDGRSVASASHDNSARLWAVDSGREVVRFNHDDLVNWVEFSASGNLISTASRDGSAKVWDKGDGKLLARIEAGNQVDGVRFSPDDRLLVLFGRKIETSFWDWRKGKQIWKLPIQSSREAGVVFSNDASQIVVGSVDGELSWWDLARQEPLFSTKTGLYIAAMRVNSAGTRIATLDTLDLVQVWDLQTGHELKRLPYARWVTGVAWSPDGDFLASGGMEFGRDYSYISEVTTIWPQDPIAAACKHIGRNLTRNEWRSFIPAKSYALTCPELGEPDKI